MAEQSLVVSTPCLATAVLSPTASSSRAGSNVARIQRNVAEKQRRDKLNGYINELANIVPMISKSARRLDKTSILRLSAAHLRICKSPLGANSKMRKAYTCCPNFLSNEQLGEIFESVDGFLIITASNGKILFTSRSVEKYLGHQDIDMIGHSLYMFIHEKDVDNVKQKMKDMLAECIEKGSIRRSFECLMKEKAQPRSEVSTYQHVHFVGSMTEADDPNSENRSKSVITHMFKAFVRIVDISPYNQLSLEEATADEYVTRHSLDGTIIYADHRLATMTGHMPNEVIGLSAYKYIHKEDMPIALFAHHLMFSNNQGTGIIVYRLHTRDNRYIFLKSVGCLQYDKVTSRVDHFVCVNQQLGDSDGDMQLKFFFDRYIPQVKGSSTSALLESVKALQLSSSESPDTNPKAIEPVASINLQLEASRISSPGSSDSTISSLSSDSPKSSEENSPECKMDNSPGCKMDNSPECKMDNSPECKMDNSPECKIDNSPECIVYSDSDQIASRENGASLLGSPEFVYHNGYVSPDSSVHSPDASDNIEEGFRSTNNDSECFIVTANGSNSGLVNGFITSNINSPLHVIPGHSVNTPNDIASPPFQISRNSHSLIEGPNNHVYNNLRMVMGPVVFNSNGDMSPAGVTDDTMLQVDAQYEFVEALSDSDQNKRADRCSLLKFSNPSNVKSKNLVESDEKMAGEINLYGHQMNGGLSLNQNGISSEDSASPLEAQSSYLLLKSSNSIISEYKNPLESDEKGAGEMNLYGLRVNGKLSLSQSGISSEDSSSPLVAQSANLDEDVFREDTAESFRKHSSFIKNCNGVDGRHSTLTVVNSCDSDSVLKNSKWHVDSFSVFQTTIEESSVSMDYCDTMPTTEGEVNGDLKDNISLQEDLSSLLSATLPHSDSNSLPSANGWNDLLNPTEYSSPFSSETTVQKDEEQLIVNGSKVKSYNLW